MIQWPSELQISLVLVIIIQCHQEGFFEQPEVKSAPSLVLVLSTGYLEFSQE